MTITVAGEKKEYKDGLTLPELIEAERWKLLSMLPYPSMTNLCQQRRKRPQFLRMETMWNFSISWEVDANGNDR